MTEAKRRPGRPATGVTPLLNVRVPEDIQARARARATREGKPFAGVVADLLTDYANRKDATFGDVAVRVGLRDPHGVGAERIAHFAGALTPHDPRTGQIPKPWTGQGIDFALTWNELDELANEWAHHAADAERMEYLSGADPEAVEIADRYRP